MRIELTSSDWKSEVMPLYDIRKFGARSGTRTHKEIIPQHFKCCAFTNLTILALGIKDSNLCILESKSSALPITPQINLVALGGIEPPSGDYESLA
ncbi:hypothetical protein [Shigella phage CT01]|nr:hypothetical protein [Shigella phage CT01]